MMTSWHFHKFCNGQTYQQPRIRKNIRNFEPLLMKYQTNNLITPPARQFKPELFFEETYFFIMSKWTVVMTVRCSLRRSVVRAWPRAEKGPRRGSASIREWRTPRGPSCICEGEASVLAPGGGCYGHCSVTLPCCLFSCCLLTLDAWFVFVLLVRKAKTSIMIVI